MGEIEPLNRKFYAWITLDDKKRRILHTASKKSCNPQRSSSGTTMWPNIPPELTSETYIIDYRLSGDVPTILHGAEGFAPSWLSFLSHKQFIFEWCDQEIKGTSQLPSINSLKDLAVLLKATKEMPPTVQLIEYPQEEQLFTSIITIENSEIQQNCSIGFKIDKDNEGEIETLSFPISTVQEDTMPSIAPEQLELQEGENLPTTPRSDEQPLEAGVSSSNTPMTPMASVQNFAAELDELLNLIETTKEGVESRSGGSSTFAGVEVQVDATLVAFFHLLLSDPLTPRAVIPELRSDYVVAKRSQERLHTEWREVKSTKSSDAMLKGGFQLGITYKLLQKVKGTKPISTFVLEIITHVGLKDDQKTRILQRAETGAKMALGTATLPADFQIMLSDSRTETIATELSKGAINALKLMCERAEHDPQKKELYASLNKFVSERREEAPSILFILNTIRSGVFHLITHIGTVPATAAIRARTIDRKRLETWLDGIANMLQNFECFTLVEDSPFRELMKKGFQKFMELQKQLQKKEDERQRAESLLAEERHSVEQLTEELAEERHRVVQLTEELAEERHRVEQLTEANRNID